METRAFIFDVDGTLVDSNTLHAEAWHRSFARHGFDVPTAVVLPQIGKGGDKLVKAVLGPEIDEATDERLREATPRIFAELAGEQGIPRYPGAQELLRELRQRGMRLAIATSGKRKDFKNVLEHSGLDVDLVHEIVTGDDVEASKPDPDLVATAVARVGVPARQCVMVGDTPYDAEAAVRAGVTCFGTATGVHDDARLRKAGASRVFRDVADLLAHIDEVAPRGRGGASSMVHG